MPDMAKEMNTEKVEALRQQVNALERETETLKLRLKENERKDCSRSHEEEAERKPKDTSWWTRFCNPYNRKTTEFTEGIEMKNFNPYSRETKGTPEDEF